VLASVTILVIEPYSFKGITDTQALNVDLLKHWVSRYLKDLYISSSSSPFDAGSVNTSTCSMRTYCLIGRDSRDHGVFKKLFGLTCLHNFAGLKYPTVQLRVHIRVVRKIGYPHVTKTVLSNSLEHGLAAGFVSVSTLPTLSLSTALIFDSCS